MLLKKIFFQYYNFHTKKKPPITKVYYFVNNFNLIDIFIYPTIFLTTLKNKFLLYLFIYLLFYYTHTHPNSDNISTSLLTQGISSNNSQ